MTESFRHSGEYHQQQSLPGHDGGTQGAYPPPPAHEPEPWGPPAGAHAGRPAGPPVATPRRRLKGPAVLLAAAAVAAAAVGGGTAYAVQTLTGHDGGTAAKNVNGTSVSTGSKGTVAGVAAAVSPSIVEISATTGSGESTGSGVIVTSDGEIVTNNHVISGATSISVRTSDGKTYQAETVGTDSKKDLALIKLKGASGLKAASLGDSDDVKVGDEVVAIGSPEGLTGTVTSGIISALDRDVTVSADPGKGQERQGPGGGGGWPFEFGGQEFNGDTGSSKTTYKALQTDASLNPGNSGGALIDMNGEVIGINSAMYAPSSGGGAGGSGDSGSVGLGFAIPVNTVKADLAKLRAGATD
ncbi:protease [Streptomyces longispororuber]|uniref:Protease n=1 Tax=Streptomyces longispororuber TaxID=68230 RepID=A0A919DMJ5_9ACTN|nr:trypsin-like peptidase domain-containing protein [Streptomyces longispororuber]GHE57593.1 protease [Streptomyces longispororuber]